MNKIFLENVSFREDINTVKAIEERLKSMTGVEFCFVKKNESFQQDLENEYGVPEPMSLSIYVKGGDDIEVAKAISDFKPIGIALNGDFELHLNYSNVRWYNLNYANYTEQKQAQNKLNRKLEKEQLLKRLAELEQEGE